MKKVVIDKGVKAVLEDEKGFLSRKDIQVFSASTTEDVLGLHRAEKVNLIIMGIDLPGMKCEDLCSLIREHQALRAVSMILLCPDKPETLERSVKCGANAVMTLPVDAAQLLERAQQLLEVPWREAYRVLLSVKVVGDVQENAFICRSENISIAGMLIETDRGLAQGDQVTCSFFLPGSKRLNISGELVRVYKRASGAKVSQYGIKFLRISDEEKSAIETFVEIKSQVSTSRK